MLLAGAVHTQGTLQYIPVCLSLTSAPLDRGIAQNPIPAVTASLRSTAAREQGAGRSTLHGPCRREQPHEEVAIQLLSSLQVWAALDVPGETDKHLSDAFFLIRSYCRTTRILRSKQTGVIWLRGQDLVR